MNLTTTYSGQLKGLKIRGCQWRHNLPPLVEIGLTDVSHGTPGTPRDDRPDMLTLPGSKGVLTNKSKFSIKFASVGKN